MQVDSGRFKKIIQEYIREGLSDDDKKKVDTWYNAVSSEEVNPFVNEHHRNQLEKELFSNLSILVTKKNKQAGIWKKSWISVAASCILIGIATVLFFYKEEIQFDLFHQTAWKEVITQPGGIKEVRLPDSSSIFLSGNAKVRFDENGFRENRKIYLDQGEAFFDIHRDSLHPFSIETGTLDIEVLGTSFNVNNALGLQQVVVNVKTGRVRVTGKQNNEEHILVAGKSLRYNTNDAVFTGFDSNPAYANIWTTGGVMLDGASFDELSELMLSRYGLVLKTDNLNTRSFSYSLLIPQVESLDQILTIICNIHQLKFRRDKNEIILYN
ncbi:FecR family protein [Sphingobacterium sp. LRF_L2]|uniref:FecR family protein n=1 Tax=Sphingobacterium sp. LRF_L2 TaxID=3369421 RepID=UPI003F631381